MLGDRGAVDPEEAVSAPTGAPTAAESGAAPGDHSEADLIASFSPRLVLDAGCGTGRVAIELVRRSINTVGVDIDPPMLDRARSTAPDIEWRLGDISLIDLGRGFDAIVLAGNVMIFLARGSEGRVLRNMARHLEPNGVLITGFQLAMGYLDLDHYDRLAARAGLQLVERWSDWKRGRFDGYSSYAVSVHRLKWTHRAMNPRRA